MVFWALEERKRMIENRKALGRAEVIADLLAEGIPQTKEELEQWARDKGIPLDKLPSPPKRDPEVIRFCRAARVRRPRAGW